MRERIRPTGSGLFAIELLICVGVFTMCAAICMGLFVRSEIMSQESADLTRAVNEARNVAECYQATGGDLDLTAQLTGGHRMETALLVDYDRDWNRLDHGGDVSFQLSLLPSREDGYTSAALVVDRDDGKTILAWHVAVLEAVS